MEGGLGVGVVFESWRGGHFGAGGIFFGGGCGCGIEAAEERSHLLEMGGVYRGGVNICQSGKMVRSYVTYITTLCGDRIVFLGDSEDFWLDGV